METKTCKKCLKNLPIDEFEVCKKGNTTFIRGQCKSCQYKKKVAAQSKSPQDFLKNLHTQLKSKRKDTHEWDITVDNLFLLWREQEGKCALSGHNMTWHRGSGTTNYNVSLDRKNPLIGYVPDNCQLVCTIVNLMKQSLSDVDFIWWCKSITENNEKHIDFEI